MKSRRVSLIPYFIGIIAVFSVFIAFIWHRSTSTYHALQQNGTVVNAKVESIQLSHYISTGPTGGHTEIVSSPQEADTLRIIVESDPPTRNYALREIAQEEAVSNLVAMPPSMI